MDKTRHSLTDMDRGSFASDCRAEAVTAATAVKQIFQQPAYGLGDNTFDILFEVY